MLTIVVVCITFSLCRETSAQIMRGRQRSYVQAPFQQPPPTRPTPPNRPVPPPPGTPTSPTPPGRPVPPGTPTTPNQPTPAVPGTPRTPDKPWYECEDCGTTTDCKGEPPCRQGENKPEIKPSEDKDCTSTVCVPVDNKPIDTLPSADGTYLPFYKRCLPFKADVDVPHYILNKADTLVFAKKIYSSPCCAYQVCVVECCCTTTTKKCDLRKRNCNLSICQRQNDHIDVYVEDVPGMPKRWVLYMDVTLDQLRNSLPDFRGF